MSDTALGAECLHTTDHASCVVISIVTPLYNASRDFPECIESVLAQTALDAPASAMSLSESATASSATSLRLEWSIYDDASSDTSVPVLLSNIFRLLARGVSVVFSSFSHPRPVRFDPSTPASVVDAQIAELTALHPASVGAASPVTSAVQEWTAYDSAVAAAAADAAAAASATAAGAPEGRTAPAGYSYDKKGRLRKNKPAVSTAADATPTSAVSAEAGAAGDAGSAGAAGAAAATKRPKLSAEDIARLRAEAAARKGERGGLTHTEARVAAAATAAAAAATAGAVGAAAAETVVTAPSAGAATPQASEEAGANVKRARFASATTGVAADGSGCDEKSTVPAAADDVTLVSGAAAPAHAHALGHACAAASALAPAAVPVSSRARDVGHARNRAVLQSRGAWLLMLDADDVAAPARAQTMWRWVQRDLARARALAASSAAGDAAPAAASAVSPTDSWVPPPVLYGARFTRTPAGSTPRYAAFLNALTARDAALLRHRDLTLVQPTWFLSRSAYAVTLVPDAGAARAWARAQFGLPSSATGARAAAGEPAAACRGAAHTPLSELLPAESPLSALALLPRGNTDSAAAAAIGAGVGARAHAAHTYDPLASADAHADAVLAAFSDPVCDAMFTRGAAALDTAVAGGFCGGGYPQSGLGTPEDLIFLQRALERGVRLGLCPLPARRSGVVYRYSGDSASASVKIAEMLVRRAEHFEATVLGTGHRAAAAAAAGTSPGGCFLGADDVLVPGAAVAGESLSGDNGDDDDAGGDGGENGTPSGSGNGSGNGGTEGKLSKQQDDMIATRSVRRSPADAAGESAAGAALWLDPSVKFGIWGCGRDGKRFYNALSPAARDRVACFYDVNPAKIGTMYREHGGSRSVPIRSVAETASPFVVCVARDSGAPAGPQESGVAVGAAGGDGEQTEGAGEVEKRLAQFQHGVDYFHLV